MSAAPNSGLDWSDSGPFMPAAYMPSQGPRSDPESGERRLLLACLVDAYDTLRKPPRHSDPTRRWFANPDSGALTLRFVCDVLNLDVAGVQAAASRLHRQAHPLRH
jgi:hypothetical protein